MKLFGDPFGTDLADVPETLQMQPETLQMELIDILAPWTVVRLLS